MSTLSKEFEIISCGDEIFEDGHDDIEMVEDQINLKHPIVCSSLCNGPVEPLRLGTGWFGRVSARSVTQPVPLGLGNF
jgi:hypothetical protein